MKALYIMASFAPMCTDPHSALEAVKDLALLKLSLHLHAGNLVLLADLDNKYHKNVGIMSSVCFSFFSFSSFAFCRRACSNLEGRETISGETLLDWGTEPLNELVFEVASELLLGSGNDLVISVMLVDDFE
jgi:hypothetical protein